MNTRSGLRKKEKAPPPNILKSRGQRYSRTKAADGIMTGTKTDKCSNVDGHDVSSVSTPTGSPSHSSASKMVMERRSSRLHTPSKRFLRSDLMVDLTTHPPKKLAIISQMSQDEISMPTAEDHAKKSTDCAGDIGQCDSVVEGRGHADTERVDDHTKSLLVTYEKTSLRAKDDGTVRGGGVENEDLHSDTDLESSGGKVKVNEKEVRELQQQTPGRRPIYGNIIEAPVLRKTPTHVVDGPGIEPTQAIGTEPKQTVTTSADGDHVTISYHVETTDSVDVHTTDEVTNNVPAMTLNDDNMMGLSSSNQADDGNYEIVIVQNLSKQGQPEVIVINHSDIKGMDGNHDDSQAGDDSYHSDGDPSNAAFKIIENANGKEVFVCTSCDYTTDERATLFKHSKSHQDKKYKCNLCTYRGMSLSNLKRHELTHTDTKLYKCEECGMSFRQKIHCIRHIQYKHKEKTVKCPLCDYMCATEAPDLRVHMKRRHSNKKDDPSVCICSECGEVTKSAKDLKQHIKFHKKGPELKFFCHQCSFVTNAKSRLDRHTLTHSKEKPYNCPMCTYEGTQKEHVMRHMEAKHAIQRTRVRNSKKAGSLLDDGLSVKATTNATTTTQSELSITGEEQKSFGCLSCPLKFSKLINLYKHLHLMHAGDYSGSHHLNNCVICDFVAADKKGLYAHMRRHTEMVKEESQIDPHVYSCVMCQYTNTKRRNLYQHLKKKHKIAIVVKKDGTAQCVVEESSTLQIVTSNTNSEGKQLTTPNLIAVEQHANVGTKLINIADIAQSLVTRKSSTGSTNTSSMSDNVVTDGIVTRDDIGESEPETEHSHFIIDETETQEAIQGLRALAEQRPYMTASKAVPTPRLVPGPSPASAPLPTSGPPPNPVKRLKVANEETVVTTKTADSAKTSASIELEHEQLMKLSTGDFIVIDGEAYKVEFSHEESRSDNQAEGDQMKTAGD